MNLYSIFPTAVGKFELGREYTAEETAFVDEQPTHKNMGNTTSNDRYVLRHDTMANLKAFVEASVGEYLRAIYAPKNEVGLRITQSWLNYCKPGEWHHKHAHANSFLSGVFYVKADKTKDKIYFHKEQYEQLKIATSEYNMFNSGIWWLPVCAGDLLIFPSHFYHSVDPVFEERVSLSFNTFPFGLLGEDEQLTGLNLKLTAPVQPGER